MPSHILHEDSPYLQQHAGNPVDWYPWSEEAFAKAKKENKPIFLSIGYSSCHWCHVMERESFEDEKIAKILNERFISIKVDKEERPDIDRHFQSVYQLMHRRAGGWPTSIFLTETLKPFYAATYIPPEPRYGMMGFDQLLRLISEKYTNEKELLTQKAEEILGSLDPKQNSIQATELDLSLIERVQKQAKQLFDGTNGGFGSAPKFPQVTTLDLLLDTYLLTKERSTLEMVLHTLTSMTQGGLYDHVDGGFCRYSTDDKWLVPHFEKMTYDNALLSGLFLRAFALTGEKRYQDIAFETIDFMLDKMSENHLFYSASDADTDGEEGKYFVFEYKDVLELFAKTGIPASEQPKLAHAMGITPEGNFEGKSIVRLQENLSAETPYYHEAINALRKERGVRQYPFIDKKVQLSWNAMMIKSLFQAGRQEAKYHRQALDSLDALTAALFTSDELYHTTLISKTPKIKAFLEDYAFYCDALIEAYKSTLDERYLIRSIQLANSAIEKYYEAGRWKFSRGEFETEADIYDSSYPSSIATMLCVLLDISALADPIYKKFVFKTLELHSYDLMRQPISTPRLSKAVMRLLSDDILIKSTPQKLQTRLGEIDSLPYPFIHFKADKSERYTLCDSSSCFGDLPEWDEVASLLASR